MAAPALDSSTVQNLISLDDVEFEKVVDGLNMRGLLDLVTALQKSMSEEQQRFDQLSAQLQQIPDVNSLDHKKMSAALCASQMRLARLCTQNMRCFTQQAIRAKKEQWKTKRCLNSENNNPVHNTISTMAFHKVPSSRVETDRQATNGFRESLNFFQNQVQNIRVHTTNGISATSDTRTVQVNNINKINNGIDEIPSKTVSRNTSSIPSVDNILKNVKSICASQSRSVFSESTLNDNPIAFKNSSNNDNFKSLNQNEIKSTSSGILNLHQSQTLHNKSTLSKTNDCDTHVGYEQSKWNLSSPKTTGSLSKNFNPTFNSEENEFSTQFTINYKLLQAERERVPSNDNLNNSALLVNCNKKKDESVSAKNYNTKLKLSEISVTEDDKNADIIEIKSFGKVEKTQNKYCDEQSSLNTKTNVEKVTQNTRPEQIAVLELPDSNKINQSHNSNFIRKSEKNISKINESLENSSEKMLDSLESDYDPQDFVVHKTAFSDDYLEIMSEDACSSITEDYEVEHPDDQLNGPDIPSPDYASEEEAEFQVHEANSEYEDEETIIVDNQNQYLADQRRYIYYPEDKELEVIPEEDEEDIEDEVDSYAQVESDQDQVSDDFCVQVQNSKDKKHNSQAECDSGVTDDQRSNSSAGEEGYTEDDTDSAKGSLLLLDSCRESPVSSEKSNLIIDTNKTTEESKNRMNNCDELIQKRWRSSSWNPKELLTVLYRMDFENDTLKEQKMKYVNMEGHLQKLPPGKKKASYWNPWKTKYIRIKDGFFYCYDNVHSKKASMTLQLMGGTVETLDSKTVGIDDKKGHFVVLRCPSTENKEEWEHALKTQCIENFCSAYIVPVLQPQSITKDVIAIDIGSCSVRAGVLMSCPTLPQLFFPSVVAIHKISKEKIFGTDALHPEIRKNCTIFYPFCISAEVTKFSIDISMLTALMDYIFHKLNVLPKNFKIQLCLSQKLCLRTKAEIANILLNDFKVKAVNITHQAVSSLHAYNSKSGIIVDIGDRMDVIPINEGYVVKAGVSRLPYGGNRMIHHLKHALMEKGISLGSDVETYIARYVLEQLCYVPEDYTVELQHYFSNPFELEMSVSTEHFFEDDCPWKEISLDVARFQVAEGLFNPELWGLDNPGVHRLVYKAIQECSMDSRKEMARSIYLSGGITLLPGFVERLESEIDNLTPVAITPKIHASKYRYHMSYLGAWEITNSEDFENFCVTKDELDKEGNVCLQKWRI